MSSGPDGTTTILSIDGGGIRGVIPAVVLEAIEDRAGRPAHELFDLVAGTSTGALIALGITLPPPDGTEPRPASALRDLYRERGPEIFEAPLGHQLVSLRGLADQRYPDDALEAALQDAFGARRLKDARTEVVVPTYDLAERQAYFFKRRRARENPSERDHTALEVARAAVAAPTYFEPALAHGPGGSDDRVLVDGGVVANNPAMCAYAEALAHDGFADDVLIVSLGTGQVQEPIAFEKAKDWGYPGWGAHLLDVLLDGAQDAVHYHLEHVLNAGDRTDYHRLQPSLTPDEPPEVPQPDESLDAADPGNIERLEDVAKAFVDDRADQLDTIVDRLTEANP